MASVELKYPLRSIPKTPGLFVDYLEHGVASQKLFPDHYLDPRALSKVAQTLRFDEPRRRAVVEMLVRQNERWGMGQATRRHLETLKDPDCFAIVTGQQVGLLTGPCYSLYKALTAIKLAVEATRRGIKCVPIFWMESTDHDLAEVDHVVLPDATSQSLSTLKLQMDKEAKDRSVGPLRLGQGLSEFYEKLRSQLPANSVFASETMTLVEECYRADITMAEAFARMMGRQLEEYGIIFLDPSDPAFGPLSRPLIRRALSEGEAVHTSLSRADQTITSAGFEPQINYDQQSTFVFFSGEGPRRLLLREKSRIRAKGSDHSLSAEEAQELLEKSPEQFTASVVLRPLVQDDLLPTVAYIGGPTEISYFAQLTGLYEWLGRPMPILVPRASFTVVPNKAQRILTKYALNFSDTFLGEERLASKVVEQLVSSQVAWELERIEKDVSAALDRIKPVLAQSDPTLGGALETSRQKILYQLTHLKTRFIHSEERRHETVMQQIQSLCNLLYPHGNLQERELNVCYFLSRYGKTFVKTIFDAIEPNQQDHTLLLLSS